MSAFIGNLCAFLVKTAPYWGLFLTAFVAALVLTPLCRNLARKLGMVDQPSARRINRTPIPRAGGLAIYLAVSLALLLGAVFFSDVLRDADVLVPRTLFRLTVLSGVLCTVGLLDDKFSLPPAVKLLGQVAVALGAFFWAGVGFHRTFPSLPLILDCAFTTFWIVGAVNAFNLIDGLDGLAAGLACIAAFGMAGALFFVGEVSSTFAFFALVGACLGFLRYNFNPASVFLGDTGSMYLGFSLATLPLLANATHSLLVGVGVPILAMGVPICDTALAILRRSIRAFLRRGNVADAPGSSRVMQADTDHLHHRILRKFLSQKKAAFGLYGLAVLLVGIGVGGVALHGRAAALYIVGFMVAVVIVFRDMKRIELWDACRLLNAVAHDRTLETRRRIHVLKMPFFLMFDVIVLVVCWLLTTFCLSMPITSSELHRWLPLRVIPIFLGLVAFRVYVTVWGRAVIADFVRLAAAIVVGTAISEAIVVTLQFPHAHMFVFSALYGAFTFIGFISVRTLRPLLRDLFYSIDCGRLIDSPGISRIVVYGTGLRYQGFRRELVRTASANRRVIVGLLDDDILLRGQYIGNIRIWGTLEQAPAILAKLKADAVVIACQMTPARRAVAKAIFATCGVPVTVWRCEETEL